MIRNKSKLQAKNKLLKYYEELLDKQGSKIKDMQHELRLSKEINFPPPKIIVESYKGYNKTCHCSHTGGEEPSFHYRNGVIWALSRIREFNQ